MRNNITPFKKKKLMHYRNQCTAVILLMMALLLKLWNYYD